MIKRRRFGFKWFESALSRWPKRWIWALCLVLSLAAGAIDYGTGTEVIPLNLYLLPLVLAAWFLDRREGVRITFFTSVVFVAADVLSNAIRLHPYIQAWNAFSMLSFFAMIFALTRQLHALLSLQKSLARMDPLTEVPNRIAFEEALEAEIGKRKRVAGPTSVALVAPHDSRNELRKLTEEERNKLLRQTGHTIRLNLRSGEIVARWGGDRFAFLVPETSPKNVKTIVEKIHYALNGLAATHDWPYKFDISAATYLTLPEQGDEVLRLLSSRLDELRAQDQPSYRCELIAG